MILLRVLRFILFFVVISWIVRLAGRFLASAHRATAVREKKSGGAKLLHRDPACGKHIPEELSHPWRDGSRVLHFCSESCRESYLAGGNAAGGPAE